MSAVQRWRVVRTQTPSEIELHTVGDDQGEWVKYDDHERALAEVYTLMGAAVESGIERVDWSGCLPWSACAHCNTEPVPDPRDRCATIRLVHGRP